jgi:Trk K+ transport system NAD-binding subunit
MSFLSHLECSQCGRRFDADALHNLCPECKRPLLARYDLDAARRAIHRDDLAGRPRGLWRFAELQPVRDPARRIMLGEGGTPLVRATRLAAALGAGDALYIKDEGSNPTGSFKARGMATAVSRAAELGARTLSAPSAGNAAGGKVGRSALRALRERGVPVQVIERDAGLRQRLEGIADRVIIGDASDLGVVTEAGVKEAPSVVLSTNSDATNIYLAVYCRKLNPDTIIVSRISRARNVEAVHRAGADFAVTDYMLGVQSLLSVIEGRELTFLGEGLDFFNVRVPPRLVGLSLREAGIRQRTGLQIVGLERGQDVYGAPDPNEPLDAEVKLLAIGTSEQREAFSRAFGPR